MGRVLIFPTDTVYGIGTPIFDLEGINKIYQIKNRSKDKPLACLCASINQIKSIALVNETAEILMNNFFPGPLTLILEANKEVIEKIGYKTIGVRIPNNKIALDILLEYGPMLTTSVNESGSIPINEYDEIKDKYSHLVDKIFYSNTNSSNISSTVVSLLNNKIEIIREGEITLSQLNEILNNV